MQVQGWIVFSFSMVMFFNCNLKANLMAAEFEKPIDSLHQEYRHTYWSLILV